MFVCTNVDPKSEDDAAADTFLTADMSISCESDYYRSGLIYACVMVVVYPLGIPLMYGVLLYRNRKYLFEGNAVPAPPPAASVDVSNPLVSSESNGRTSDKEISANEEVSGRGTDSEIDLPDSVKRLRFLWGSYSPQLWYWEIVETYRRLTLTAILSVCGTGTSKQAVLSVVLSIFFIKLYNWKSPYLDKAANIMAEVGMFQIFFSFFAALCIQNSLLPDWETFLGWFLVLMNLSVIYLPLYHQCMAQRKGVKVKEDVEVEMVLINKSDGADSDEKVAGFRFSDKRSLASFDGAVRSKHIKTEELQRKEETFLKARLNHQLAQQNCSNESTERENSGYYKQRKWIEGNIDFTSRQSEFRDKTNKLSIAGDILVDSNIANFEKSYMVESDNPNDKSAV